ncbi:MULTISPECIES: PTS glucitol/sorbitol transporter subunit IIA [Cedecea]|jgi:PTS system glucitol/sorbitol-specific IIA component|uniref:PTS system glucitol/sorbitol-specific transporter subunit IIA n=1 Tax=Cedecea neteri TaxID=158822 RepID=A0A089RIA9_9ENTR|nr:MULTISPECIES: PTS glucitol/sorbitol transporter subunit IIA [Cedecea]AIR06215.1 PTS system glucitol/sorbitol-specific transporter subunit IIA [Cedecea neteri]MRT57595.1 PTS glucitol/sorbitol transporter subunit IIA [Enterobacteriaceae bacterium RIT693]NWC61816.1 PTS glucitol/sorbitol transporter subunit IIA [Cedecea sp. P7760]
MQTIYQTTITHIGRCAREALEDNMLITFREGAPADIQDYCFIHCHGELTGKLKPGIGFELNGQHYAVTAVGDVAQQNLQELGHITLRFDGEAQAEYPGTVHVNGPLPQGIEPGCRLKFVA